VLLKRWDQIDFMPASVADDLRRINDAAMQNDNHQAWCMVNFGPLIGVYIVGKAVRMVNNRSIGRVGLALSAKNKARVDCEDKESS
jgi:hypothetical protein